MNKINKTKKDSNITQPNSKKEDLDKKNSKSYFIKNALLNTELSFFKKDTNDYDTVLNTDSIIEILESDYKDNNLLSSDDSDLINDDLKSSSESSTKKKFVPNLKNKPYTVNLKNHNSDSNSIVINSKLNTDFLPSRNKKDPEHVKNLNRIINTLKNDYRNLTEIYDSFQKYNFSSVDIIKSNKFLNNFEKKSFTIFKDLDTIHKSINNDNQLKIIINKIFKTDDISAHCVMYAYNIYSFIKMFHYTKNISSETNTKKRNSSSVLNNVNNFKFKKEQFDLLKEVRDDKIKYIESKTSNNTTSEESSNLKKLRDERSIMEGYKSNIRLNSININQTQNLNDSIKNSKKLLNGIVFNAHIIPSNNLEDFALKSADLALMCSKLYEYCH